MSVEETSSTRRTLVGKIVSDKMDRTVTVEVVRRVKHPVYHKYLNRSKSYKAHDADNAYSAGEIVTIEETRPLSKTKRWRVVGRKSN